MKIQRIDSGVSKVNKANGLKSVKSFSQPNFNGNYYSVYNSALTQSLRNYNDAVSLFRKLANAAKTESGLFRGTYFSLLEEDATSALKDARESSFHTGDLLTSTSYPSPLVTMNRGEISFHHPHYGEFGNGNISFWLSGDNELNLDRPKDYHKFYAYGVLKEFYRHIEGGGIMDHVYYNRDGSKNTLKNFFLT